MSISMTMVPLMAMVSFMSVRPFLLLDIAFEIAELVLPHVAVVREPVVDASKRRRVELVQPIAPDLDLAYELGFAQDAQVPRDRRTADRKIARDAAHRLAALLEQRENRTPSRVGERLENVTLVHFIGNRLVTHLMYMYLRYRLAVAYR